ncbi:MAG: hypothetical protein KKB03_00385 [Nanoarchaeota archaeon]|nr:hypothetical protein [Nanoarchaeota archaeon]MBU1135444.1 hypothetical protein [Nanoarchaeota archaeon]MBU2519686.1 hypothetical protein [Nanoarchaeota archaeon]
MIEKPDRCNFGCRGSSPLRARTPLGVYCCIEERYIVKGSVCNVSDIDFKQYIDDNKLEGDEEST